MISISSAQLDTWLALFIFPLSRILGLLASKTKRAIEGKEDGHQRELLKILHRMKLSARDEGLAFDACVGLWEKIDAQPSVRVNALKLLVSIARRYPELIREIRFLTQERYLASCSLPVRRSIARMLKGLD